MLGVGIRDSKAVEEAGMGLGAGEQEGADEWGHLSICSGIHLQCCLFYMEQLLQVS